MADILQLQALLAANGIAAPVPKARANPKFTVREVPLDRWSDMENVPEVLPENNPYHVDMQRYRRDEIFRRHDKAYLVYDAKDKLAGVVAVKNSPTYMRVQANLGEGVGLKFKNDILTIDNDAGELPILIGDAVRNRYDEVYVYGPVTQGKAAIDLSGKDNFAPMQLHISGGTDVKLGDNSRALLMRFYHDVDNSSDYKVDTRIQAPGALLKNAPVTKNMFERDNERRLSVCPVDALGKPCRKEVYTQRLANNVVIKTGWVKPGALDSLPDIRMTLSIDGEDMLLMDTRAVQAQARETATKREQPLNIQEELDLLNGQLKDSERRLEEYKKKADALIPENGHGLPPAAAPAKGEMEKGKSGRR